MKISAQILSYETCNAGHTEYLLEVSLGCSKWQIRHRYNDFVKLDESIRQEGVDIQAQLPPKNLFDRFKEDFLKNRVEKLGEYLDTLISEIQISSSPALDTFLGTASKQSELQLMEKFEEERKSFRVDKDKAIEEALKEVQDKEKVKQDLWMTQIEREKTKSQELEIQIAELKATLKEEKEKSEETVTSLKSEVEKINETISQLQLEKSEALSKLDISKKVISQLKEGLLKSKNTSEDSDDSEGAESSSDS